jgi:hypothetical protein
LVFDGDPHAATAIAAASAITTAAGARPARPKYLIMTSPDQQ